MLHSESECQGKGCPEHSYPPEKKPLTWQARQPEIDLLYSLIADKDVAIIDLKSLLKMAKEEIDRLKAEVAEAEKKGRKEVVAWIEANTHPSSFKQGECDFREFELKTWQKFKKGLGI